MRGWVSAALREATWLTPARARAYAALLFLGQLLMAAFLLSGEGLLDPAGRPLGTDFASFWAASLLALDGQPAVAWDPIAHHAAQRALFGPEVNYYAFFYPPSFLLVCLPLALLPYGWSLAAWLAVTGAAWWATLRRILPGRAAALAMLAFPAAWLNLTHGQNAFLTAALLGAAALALQRRPVLAGLCIGLLAVKPQIAVAIPLALLAAGRWRAIVAAAASVAALLGVATLVLGVESWRAFLAASSLARQTLEGGLVEPGKMVSVFAAVRVLGGGVGLAYGVQALVALGTAAILVVALRQRPGGVGELALAAAATPLLSPFLLDYDLVLLGLPLAWMLSIAQRSGGFLPWEKVILSAGFVLPFVARPAALGLSLPVAPLITVALLLAVARRLQAERAGRA
jgi:hypothetical protein